MKQAEAEAALLNGRAAVLTAKAKMLGAAWPPLRWLAVLLVIGLARLVGCELPPGVGGALGVAEAVTSAGAPGP